MVFQGQHLDNQNNVILLQTSKGKTVLVIKTDQVHTQQIMNNFLHRC